MKIQILFYPIFLIGILNVSCDKTPTLNECLKYNGDENACKSHGCSISNGWKTVNRNGDCVGFEYINCVPINEPHDCSNAEGPYCHDNSDGTKEVLIMGGSCNYNLGNNWYACYSIYDDISLKCYQKQEICSSQSDKQACLENYCAWVSKGYKAIIENDQCTGWDATPISGCFSTYRPYNHDLSTLTPRMWQTYVTNDGTIMMKVIDLEYSINTHGEDPSTIYCYKDGINQPEICNCPDPPE